MSATTITVADRYPVLIGPGVSADGSLTELIPAGVMRVLVIHPEDLAHLAAPVIEQLQGAGLQVEAAGVPDAEAAKSAQVASALWAQLGESGFTRSDLIVGVGGGSVTDLAGFVAATWLRGVAIIQVPTTVLGMVDAAVGGKTGINTDQGKNLVGSFHEPSAVLCDTNVLASLPAADIAAGLAEVIKCGFIRDEQILRLIEADPAAAVITDGPVMRELIERSIQVKADVVAADLKESNLREILNYGHTLAHAIEQHENYSMRHGDAVAIGCVYAAELAQQAGLLDAESVALHRRVLGSVGLPITYQGATFDDLWAAMQRDKKTRGDLVRFVGLSAIGQPTRIEGPSQEWLRTAFDRVQQAPA